MNRPCEPRYCVFITLTTQGDHIEMLVDEMIDDVKKMVSAHVTDKTQPVK